MIEPGSESKIVWIINWDGVYSGINKSTANNLIEYLQFLEDDSTFKTFSEAKKELVRATKRRLDDYKEAMKLVNGLKKKNVEDN